MMRNHVVLAVVLAAPFADSFALTSDVALRTGAANVPVVCGNGRSGSLILRMSEKSAGFGKAQPVKKNSKLAEDRSAAADRYEKIKASGSPEFSVFFRAKGANDEDGMLKGGWYPVGSITCPSSQLIGRAVFNSEDALLQGAYRIHAKQIVKQFKTTDGKVIGSWQQLRNCDLEYGYQLKDFPDEEIKLVEKPKEPSQLEQAFGGFFQKVQDAVNWVPEK